MGKILKALDGVHLTASQKREISKLDLQLSHLEEFFNDQQTTMKEHAFLQEPPTSPKPRVPLNEEQGTGKRLQRSAITSRKPFTSR